MTDPLTTLTLAVNWRFYLPCQFILYWKLEDATYVSLYYLHEGKKVFFHFGSKPQPASFRLYRPSKRYQRRSIVCGPLFREHGINPRRYNGLYSTRLVVHRGVALHVIALR